MCELDKIAESITFVKELPGGSTYYDLNFIYKGKSINVVYTPKTKESKFYYQNEKINNPLFHDLLKEILTPAVQRALKWELDFAIMDKDSRPVHYME